MPATQLLGCPQAQLPQQAPAGRAAGSQAAHAGGQRPAQLSTGQQRCGQHGCVMWVVRQHKPVVLCTAAWVRVSSWERYTMTTTTRVRNGCRLRGACLGRTKQLQVGMSTIVQEHLLPGGVSPARMQLVPPVCRIEGAVSMPAFLCAGSLGPRAPAARMCTCRSGGRCHPDAAGCMYQAMTPWQASKMWNHRPRSGTGGPGGGWWLSMSAKGVSAPAGSSGRYMLREATVAAAHRQACREVYLACMPAGRSSKTGMSRPAAGSLPLKACRPASCRRAPKHGAASKGRAAA